MTMKVKEEERRGKREGREWGLLCLSLCCVCVFCEV
jgi:hypothetical protein